MARMPRAEDEDTICAQITPQGRGGLSAIRVSGKRALGISKKVCSFLPKNPKTHQAYFGFFKYQKEIIDEVIILFFEKGRSFTSEETVEIFCHGNPDICLKILNIFQKLGCRFAHRGEFTYRAFLSGRIDLIQAESILHLIEAGSEKSRRQSLRFLQGKFSEEITEMKNQVKTLITHVEAEIDFSEENLKTKTAKDFSKEILNLQKKTNSLLKNYKQGSLTHSALKVGIFGPPNSGKSSLFNSLMKEDKVIVSRFPGTTRDSIEGEFFLEGQKIKIIDSAGLRKTENTIEKQGIKRADQILKTCDICLYVLSVEEVFLKDFNKTFLKLKKENKKHVFEKFYEDFFNILKSKDQKIAFVFNKIDLKSKKIFLSEIKKKFSKLHTFFLSQKCFFISAKQRKKIDSINQFFLEETKGGEEAVYLPRHYDHLQESRKHLENSMVLLNKGFLELELLSFELREVLANLQALLGEEINTDVLDDIFKNFCIGK